MFSTVRTSLISRKVFSACWQSSKMRMSYLFLLLFICFFSLCPQNNSLAEWCYKKYITYRTYDNYHPIPVPLNLVTIPTVALYNLGKRCRETHNNKTKKTEETVCDHGKQRVIVKWWNSTSTWYVWTWNRRLFLNCIVTSYMLCFDSNKARSHWWRKKMREKDAQKNPTTKQRKRRKRYVITL